MDINYKIIDTQRIIDYITSFPKGVSVEEIIQNSGAEKLRVYPALFELEQSGFLEVLSGYFVLGSSRDYSVIRSGSGCFI